jgi:hypothetical protein
MSCYRHKLRKAAKGGRIASKGPTRVLATAAKRVIREAPEIEGESARPRLDRPGGRRKRFAGGGGVAVVPSLGDIDRLGVEEATRQERARINANRQQFRR